MRMGIRLGIDVGSVRVGVAASDPDGILATPVATIKRDLQSGSDLGVIAELVRERHVLEVVVGLPRSLNGGEGPAAKGAREYAALLASRISPTPVRLMDERLSTIDAHRTLRDSGVPGRAQRAVVDQVAAVLILQCSLDAEKSTGQASGELLATRKARTPRTRKTGSRP